MENSNKDSMSFRITMDDIQEECYKRFVEKSKEGKSGWDTDNSADLLSKAFFKLIEFIGNDNKKSYIDTFNFMFMAYNACKIKGFGGDKSEASDIIAVIDKVISTLKEHKQQLVEDQLSAISKS